MAHAQKPDLVFQRNGRVHLYRRGCQFSRLLATEVSASAVVMLDRPCPIQCTTAGYPLHSPFSPSLLHPCVSVCHHIQFLLYSQDTAAQQSPKLRLETCSVAQQNNPTSAQGSLRLDPLKPNGNSVSQQFQQPSCLPQEWPQCHRAMGTACRIIGTRLQVQLLLGLFASISSVQLADCCF